MLAHAALLLIGMTQSDFSLDSLEKLMASDPAAATRAIRTRFKTEDLKAGILPHAEGTKVLFARENGNGEPVKVVRIGAGGPAGVILRLEPLTDGLVAGIKTFEHGEAFRCRYLGIDPQRPPMELEVYEQNPFGQPKEGGLQGELRDMGELRSKTFPGTTRRWLIYLPKDYSPKSSHSVLIATDAQWDRQWMAQFLDNMQLPSYTPSHPGESIEPTVGIFIEPGQSQPGTYSNRSKEYDSLTGDYAKFLLEEILPEVEKIVPLSKDPNHRALVGMSSGGICAFTACWERPDQFGVAISFVGSFTNIASGESKRDGGHNYPFLIRKTEKKPIRVYLQDGENDLNNDHGSWWLANLQMESALRYKGYDYRWVPGKGFHNTKQARSIFDQVLRWWQYGS